MPGTFEFSFSGLKTAVSYYLRDNKNASKTDICAAFQSSVVETLVKKTLEAAKKYKVKTIAVGGGVAANNTLEEFMKTEAKKAGLEARFVKKGLSSDNAAMIALAAYKKIQFKAKQGKINIDPNMIIRSWNK